MIHLFKKVYIETDQKLDVDENRIVISETTGYSVSSNFEEAFIGKLYYCAENFESMLKNFGAEEIAEKNKPENQIDSGNAIIVKEDKELFDDFFAFLDFVDKCYEEIQEPLYIHVDQKAFNFFMVHWYKILFSDIDALSLIELLKSQVFYNKAFGSYFRSKMRSLEFDLNCEEDEIKKIFDDIKIDEQKSSNFVTLMRKNLSIEFLLSSYFYDKVNFKDLLYPISNLLKKSIEIQMYEIKELFLQNLNKNFFLEEFNFLQKYNFNNFYDILEKEEEFSFMYDRNIWKKTNNVIEGSSSGTIDFNNLTEKNIETMIKIRSLFEMTKEERDNLGYNSFIQQCKNLVKFMNFLKEKDTITEMELQELLDYDIKNKNNFYYSFFSNEGPINIYFLDYIFFLERNNDLEKLKKYTLR